MKLLQKQKSNGSITFRGEHLYPTGKNPSVESAKNIQHKEEQRKSDSEDVSNSSIDTIKDERGETSGSRNERIHLIWSPLEGSTPDFHQPELFPPCPDLRNPID